MSSKKSMTYAATEEDEVFESPCCESDLDWIAKTNVTDVIGRAQLNITDRNPELSEVLTKVSWPFQYREDVSPQISTGLSMSMRYDVN